MDLRHSYEVLANYRDQYGEYINQAIIEEKTPVNFEAWLALHIDRAVNELATLSAENERLQSENRQHVIDRMYADAVIMALENELDEPGHLALNDDEEYVDNYLRWHGYDPDQVVIGLKQRIGEALAEARKALRRGE